MLAAVDTGALLEVVWVSLVAGIGVTAMFALVLYGTARSAEAKRAGQGPAATGFMALALAAGAVFVAGLGLGVRIMIGG